MSYHMRASKHQYDTQFFWQWKRWTNVSKQLSRAIQLSNQFARFEPLNKSPSITLSAPERKRGFRNHKNHLFYNQFGFNILQKQKKIFSFAWPSLITAILSSTTLNAVCKCKSLWLLRTFKKFLKRLQKLIETYTETKHDDRDDIIYFRKRYKHNVCEETVLNRITTVTLCSINSP